jgi:serine phosphatase RsbU (regulator of sigma subunit)
MAALGRLSARVGVATPPRRHRVDYQLTGYLGDTKLSWPVPEGITHVGHSSTHDVSIPDRSVSRSHAILRRDGDQIEVEDLGSRNGTYIDGERIEQTVEVRPGTKLTFGNVSMHLGTDASSVSYGEDTDLNTLRFTWDELNKRSQAGGESGASLFSVFTELGEFLVHGSDMQDLYETSLTAIERLIPFELACLVMLNEAGEAIPRATRLRGSHAKRQLALSRSMVNAVLRQRTSLLVKDAQDPSLESLSESVVVQRIRSAMVVPMFDNNEVLGVLYVDSRDPATRYTKKHLRRLALLANLLAMKISNTRLLEAQREKAQELEAAARIQRNFLTRSPWCPDGYDLHVRLDSCAEVAGDLYDVLVLPSERYLFVLGDVVGHGMGAALVMANVLAALRALVRHVESPRELVETLHDEMLASVDPRSYVTLFLGVLDPGSHVLEYVNAGHEAPAIYTPGGGLRRLDSTAAPVGMRVEVPVDVANANIGPGELFCAWSDGIPEAHRPDEQPVRFLHEHEPIEEMIQKDVRGARGDSLQSLSDLIFQRVREWLGGASPTDDQTLLLLRRRSQGSTKMLSSAAEGTPK